MAKFREKGYAVRTRKATEEFIKNHTVEEVAEFIRTNGKVEEDDDEVAMFIPRGEKKFAHGKTYDMVGAEFKNDEFIITDDGRVFYSASLHTNIEIING